MQIARELSGYTPGGADILRRAMGKKLPEEMNKQRNDFISGAVERGVKHQVVAQIFDLIEHFAGYGFNKAHSTAYALIAYQTAWFKTHYPAAFMAAVLTVDMGNTDKVVEMIYECLAMELRVEPPDVNRSQNGFTMLDDKTILYGLGAIRTVGSGMVQQIIEERDANGPYKSLMDFCVRGVPRKVRKNIVEAMLRAGALDLLGQTRSEMLCSLEAVYNCAEARAHDQLVGQDSLFNIAADEEIGGIEMSEAAAQTRGEFSHAQLLRMEKDTLGLYLSEHPVTRFESELRKMIGRCLSDEAEIRAFEGQRNQAPVHRLAGVIVGVTRKGQRGRGAMFTLDDGSRRLTFGMYDKDYEEYGHLLSHEGVVIVEGRKTLDAMRTNSRWYAKHILTLDQARLKFAKSLSISLNAATIPDGFSGRLRESLAPFVTDGRCPVRVRFENSDACAELTFGEDWCVRPCGELFRRVKSLDGIHDVHLVY